MNELYTEPLKKAQRHTILILIWQILFIYYKKIILYIEMHIDTMHLYCNTNNITMDFQQ